MSGKFLAAYAVTVLGMIVGMPLLFLHIIMMRKYGPLETFLSAPYLFLAVPLAFGFPASLVYKVLFHQRK